MNQPLERRTLLRNASLAGLTAASYGRVLGANDRIRTAFVGLGNRGHNALIPAALHLDLDIAAVCDIFAPHLDRALTLINAESGARPDSYADYRLILDRDDIDAVFIAVPEHWHARMVIAACEAKKDVYVEKPLAHTVEECLAIPETAREHERVVQVGLQQRSMKIYRDALEKLNSGVIGPVERCEMVWGSGSASSVPPGPVSEPPDSLDWEAWQGPAPHHPYREARHRRWHRWWDYGHGQLSDLGVHLMDVARWFMGVGAPLTCYAAGYHSDGFDIEERVPNVIDAVWQADGALITYSNKLHDMMNRFWGSGGSLFVNREIIRTTLVDERRRVVDVKEEEVREPGYEDTTVRKFVVDTVVHIQNFVDCIRTREKPNAGPEESAQSTIACLLAARAMRERRLYTWNGRRAV